MAKKTTSPSRITIDNHPKFQRAALKLMGALTEVSPYSEYCPNGLTLPAMSLETGCDVRRSRYVLSKLKDLRAFFVFRETRFEEAKAKMSSEEYSEFIKEFKALKKPDYRDPEFVKKHFDLMVVGYHGIDPSINDQAYHRGTNYVGMIISADQPAHSRVTLINYVDSYGLISGDGYDENWGFDRHVNSEEASEGSGDFVLDFAKILGISFTIANLQKNPKRSKLLSSHFMSATPMIGIEGVRRMTERFLR